MLGQAKKLIIVFIITSLPAHAGFEALKPKNQNLSSHRRNNGWGLVNAPGVALPSPNASGGLEQSFAGALRAEMISEAGDLAYFAIPAGATEFPEEPLRVQPETGDLCTQAADDQPCIPQPEGLGLKMIDEWARLQAANPDSEDGIRWQSIAGDPNKMALVEMVVQRYSSLGGSGQPSQTAPVPPAETPNQGPHGAPNPTARPWHRPVEYDKLAREFRESGNDPKNIEASQKNVGDFLSRAFEKYQRHDWSYQVPEDLIETLLNGKKLEPAFYELQCYDKNKKEPYVAKASIVEVGTNNFQLGFSAGENVNEHDLVWSSLSNPTSIIKDNNRPASRLRSVLGNESVAKTEYINLIKLPDEKLGFVRETKLKNGGTRIDLCRVTNEPVTDLSSNLAKVGEEKADPNPNASTSLEESAVSTQTEPSPAAKALEKSFKLALTRPGDINWERTDDPFITAVKALLTGSNLGAVEKFANRVLSITTTLKGPVPLGAQTEGKVYVTVKKDAEEPTMLQSQLSPP